MTRYQTLQDHVPKILNVFVALPASLEIDGRTWSQPILIPLHFSFPSHFRPNPLIPIPSSHSHSPILGSILAHLPFIATRITHSTRYHSFHRVYYWLILLITEIFGAILTLHRSKFLRTKIIMSNDHGESSVNSFNNTDQPLSLRFLWTDGVSENTFYDPSFDYLQYGVMDPGQQSLAYHQTHQQEYDLNIGMDGQYPYGFNMTFNTMPEVLPFDFGAYGVIDHEEAHQ
jgi:hypothetical protein